jgi:hypothetical protein
MLPRWLSAIAARTPVPALDRLCRACLRQCRVRECGTKLAREAFDWSRFRLHSETRRVAFDFVESFCDRVPRRAALWPLDAARRIWPRPGGHPQAITEFLSFRETVSIYKAQKSKKAPGNPTLACFC